LTPLGATPDYVRLAGSTGKVWVTEPRREGIEIFALRLDAPMRVAYVAFVSVPGGPESLAIDKAAARAYTNLWTDETIVLDLMTRETIAEWPNGCAGSRGLALDSASGLLFVGCEEGKLSVLDLKTGKRVGEASSGSGVDIIAYNPALRHVYLPGAASATLAIVGISQSGEATVLGTLATSKGAHCAAADNKTGIYVCDPDNGRILVFQDPFPASK
jgi:DNA-binding beta-propeller fold protein YncE